MNEKATAAAMANKKRTSIVSNIVMQTSAPLQVFTSNKPNGSISVTKNNSSEGSSNVTVSIKLFPMGEHNFIYILLFAR